MTTRGATRRTRATFQVDPRNFAWSRWVAATLTHVSLPWFDELAGLPLGEAAGGLGERDRLSLLAQFAAHQAFLRFAGLGDGAFEPDDWGVVTSRGCDARLVRVRAADCDLTQTPPVVAIAGDAARFLGVSLEILGRPLARADHVYAQAFMRVAGDISADLRWARRAAFGTIESPGPELLGRLADEPASYGAGSPSSCVTALRRLAAVDDALRLQVLSGVSPLQRLSALRAVIRDGSLSEAVAAERIIAAMSGSRTITVVVRGELLDAASARVIEIASAAGHGVWICAGGASPLPAPQWFVIAPTLAVRATVESRLASAPDPAAWLEELVFSPQFIDYVTRGELPVGRIGAIEGLAEPTRSFAGALALIGQRIPVATARCFLQHFLFSGDVAELCVPGVLELQDEVLTFANEDARRLALTVIPRQLRPSLCRVAANLTEGTTAAILWHEAGEPARAVAILERSEWPSPEATVEALGSVPRSLLASKIANRYARALVDCGRYADAREIALLADADDRDLVTAMADRRTGDYALAIERLARMKSRTFDAQLLYAELLRLTDRTDDAAVELSLCRADTEERRVRVGYELSVLSLECGVGAPGDWMCDHYLAHRFAAYRALAQGMHAEAAASATAAWMAARTTGERIDASLDRLYAAFVAGAWDDARAIGIEALQLVEETQGDRAAGGILFTLAFLAADNGQWEYAAHRIEVLRRYYAGVHDERRESELRLLTAHLEFGRGRFESAASAATELFERRRAHDQIREAAALILDEVDWIEHRTTELRSASGAGNVELERRCRRIRTLRAGGRVDRRPPLRVCDRLEMFREAAGRGEQEEAHRIAVELNLTYEPAAASSPSAELELLRLAATRDFPFGPRDLPRSWCFATRNRLGQWNSIGPASSTPGELESLLSNGAPDWMRCGERELLFIAGSARWGRDTRDAVAALFRLRAENERMRRLFVQEDTAARPANVAPEGMIGESMAMRAVYERVARLSSRDVPVCIGGESGTGKELVARAIHRQSSRKQKPFVSLNCAALPDNLIESEMFGHTRGAFTGADRDRAGLIEAADGGTLFLDEIGELPLNAQAKLLRFLQDGEYRRVGDTATRTADVRIVSATHRPLESRVEEGLFRDDLYYRVKVVEIHLPPLRDRGGDIALLAAHFLALERQRHRGGASSLSEDAEAAIAAYAWPGNVRELQNTIRAAHALAGDVRQIGIDHLPDRLRAALHHSVQAGSYQDAVIRFKRDLIERSLAQASGNQNKAAALLKISRQALAYQIRELGILVGRQAVQPV